MALVENLLNYLTKNKEPKLNTAPEGLCPNCWGRQEYGGNFYNAVKNHGLDVNSKYPEVGWIKDYAETHLKGIRLEVSDDAVGCPTCKITYKPK